MHEQQLVVAGTAPGSGASVGVPLSVHAMEGISPTVAGEGKGLSGVLLAWRAGEGLSRLAAAQRLGIAHTTLRSWEVLGVCPQPVHLHQLAAVLPHDVEQLRALIGPDRVRTVRTSGGEGASALCRARLTAGLTMTQLALKLGVVPSTVSRWENGVRTPAPEIWPRLVTALRLDPSLWDAVLAENPARRSEGVHLPGLGQLRRDRGLTQRAFRTALGIGPTSAVSWEHGRVRVPVHRLDDVAGVLGVDRTTLLAAGVRAPRGRTGERPLADLRTAAGLTQRELALHLGVSVRTVAHWEAGSRPVPLAAGRPLARLLRRPLPRIVAAAGLEPARVPSPHTWRPADLPQVVTVLRRSSGWSAVALGRRIGVSGWTVRSWEAGTTLPSLSACQRLEWAHGLPRDSLTRLRRSTPRPAAQRSMVLSLDAANSPTTRSALLPLDEPPHNTPPRRSA
ncbi:helix-turn-helix domain-containing protein [Geodermatophilus sabuli]|uniref:Helix-turn-helix domain-containing protein n=1 Tax=Geodermatophilus sabuli TaxID=1564158 RepID=A0A285EAK4_9ACTN|nr:helix-turn-helix domain-containing protein [Geodermatophilus sabuli]MBB3085568.1 transcriptional regulator with XRE-family HTH domain [Geodermatophilus sabuli]SNX96010.1 Helix-turn-helix domain-containing protein [Geodermatophilus sabuli]